jgi:hypothetical protein
VGEEALRVSVATVNRVLFNHPVHGQSMLALERKATAVREADHLEAYVRAQPFGGAIRIMDNTAFGKQIGEFEFDSEKSRAEQDFRILIPSSRWEIVRNFCLAEFKNTHGSLLEINPLRELAEEFADTLQENLEAEQHLTVPVNIVVENSPAPTANLRALDHPTARIYRVFETLIIDPHLVHRLLVSCETVSDQDLARQALEDHRQGGPGWANSILVTRLTKLVKYYAALTAEERHASRVVGNTTLEGNLYAVLDDLVLKAGGTEGRQNG